MMWGFKESWKSRNEYVEERIVIEKGSFRFF